jgi:hypothetical protein
MASKITDEQLYEALAERFLRDYYRSQWKEYLKYNEASKLLTSYAASRPGLPSEEELDAIMRWAVEARRAQWQLDGVLRGLLVITNVDNDPRSFTFDETHNYDALNLTELRAECRNRELDHQGTKATLVDRLREDDGG